MDFSYGVIAAVGVLVAISLGFIVIAPDDIIEPRVILEEKSTVCTMEYVPVCGVDGETYGNMCTLNASDVKLDHKGKCLTEAEKAEAEKAEAEKAEAEKAEAEKAEAEKAEAEKAEAEKAEAEKAEAEKAEAEKAEAEKAEAEKAEAEKAEAEKAEAEKAEAEKAEAEKAEAEKAEAEKAEAEKAEAEKAEAEKAEAASVTVSIPQGSGVAGCEVNNECFLPHDITIPIGTTVIWNNDDTAAHTVTSGIFADGFDGMFDSRMFTSGSAYEFTFNDSGRYDYFCLVHPWMVGVVNVGDSQIIDEAEPTPETISEIKTTPEAELASTVTTTEMALTVSIPNGAGVSDCETPDKCFSPHSIAIPVGATVTWNNDDIAAHTVTSGNVHAGSTGVFDSRLFVSGSTYEFTFKDPGTYDYFCNVHPAMIGIIHVG